MAKTKAKPIEVKKTAKAPVEDAKSTKRAVPKSSLTSAVTSDLPGAAQEDKAAQDQAYEDMDAIAKSGLGVIRVDGSGFEYVGSRDKDAETPGGIKVSGENSTFRPLATVPFSNSIRVQDPKSGEYYFPPDGCTSWEGCELNGSYLIERKTKKANG